MTKQTAVEWLALYIKSITSLNCDEIIEKAKEMEKEKQKYFFDCGRQYQLTGEGTFNEVYNETYGGTNDNRRS
jgi:hypothetical protein